jgi:hypothetical protein
MIDDGTLCAVPGAVAQDDADPGTAVPHLLDMVRRLRARERGYLAGVLHDGPIQELAAAPLELAEARRALGTSPRDELGLVITDELDLVAQQVDAAGQSLRSLQDELWPFPPPSSGLDTALRLRTGWLLDTPLAVDASVGAAGLSEAEIQVVADIVELILAGLVSPETPAPAGALAAVRADRDLIFLELTMTPAPASDPASADPAFADPVSSAPAAARASLRSLAAVIQAGADLGRHGRRWRVRMEIPRRPDHQSGRR